MTRKFFIISSSLLLLERRNYGFFTAGSVDIIEMFYYDGIFTAYYHQFGEF